jgi:hypothetical protein
MIVRDDARLIARIAKIAAIAVEKSLTGKRRFWQPWQSLQFSFVAARLHLCWELHTRF